MFPENDNQFEEHVIDKVDAGERGGYGINWDGCGMYTGDDCPVEPKVGDTVRLYGKGFGYRVRGMFINGAKVYYRTEPEDREHDEIERYGADAADWLRRWDEGKSVWSIEMGGMGPGYEQCIHITAAEVLRYLLKMKPELDGMADDAWHAFSDAMDQELFKIPAIKALGLSGAQHGAAVHLAGHFYRKGPRGVMKDEKVKDRHIMVSRYFPQAA